MSQSDPTFAANDMLIGPDYKLAELYLAFSRAQETKQRIEGLIGRINNNATGWKRWIK